MRAQSWSPRHRSPVFFFLKNAKIGEKLFIGFSPKHPVSTLNEPSGRKFNLKEYLEVADVMTTKSVALEVTSFCNHAI